MRKSQPLGLVVAVSLLPLVACGDRTELAFAAASTSTPARAVTPSTGDGCPSAVVGPKPMIGNCSTRDGRARARVPRAPHITWTTKVLRNFQELVGDAPLTSDAMGGVYVVSGNESTRAVIRRFRVADGSLAWTAPITSPVLGDLDTPDLLAPILLAGGPMDLLVVDQDDQQSLLELSLGTGVPKPRVVGGLAFETLAMQNSPIPPNPAVGVDGSLYFVHVENLGSPDAQSVLSRVRPDGAVAWSLVLGPGTPSPDGTFATATMPSTIALGQEDLVVLVVSKGAKQTVIAVDANTGSEEWSTKLDGQLFGGPVIEADGTIGLIAGLPRAESLVLLVPRSGAAMSVPLSSAVTGSICAVTRDGVFLVRTFVEPPEGAPLSGYGVAALGRDGTMLWSESDLSDATVADDGTVVVWGGDSISAVDAATWTTKWRISPPSVTSEMVVTLTSAGGLVGLTFDGTLFGASD